MILTRAVDEERMEEDRVSLLHVKVNPLSVLHAFDAVVHLVHAALPVRVVVLEKVKLMKWWNTSYLLLFVFITEGKNEWISLNAKQ